MKAFIESHTKGQAHCPICTHTVPADIDQNVAKLKLKSLGVNIDTLTPEQAKYLASWSEGT